MKKIEISKDKNEGLKLIMYDVSPNCNEPIHISISSYPNVINKQDKQLLVND